MTMAGSAASDSLVFDDRWATVTRQVKVFCRRNARSTADAEDLSQLIATRAWRGRTSFRGDSSYLTWVLRIAEREASRLHARYAIRDDRELSLDPGSGFDVPAAERERPRDCSWLVPAIHDAERAGALRPFEARVILRRLAPSEENWVTIGVHLGASATNCAVSHYRGVAKLRVFVFVSRPEVVGGIAALHAAFVATGADLRTHLTALESEVFERIVLDRRRDYRRRGWQAALRGACAKVAQHMAVE